MGDQGIRIMLYADDMVLVSNSKAGLQQSLNAMYEYFTCWKLNVNLSKSNVLVCRRRELPVTDEVWYYGDQLIDVCKSYTYLGITFTQKGINNTSLDVLGNQAKKSLAGLQANLYNIGTFPPAVSPVVSCQYHTYIVLWCRNLGSYEG